MIFGAIVALRAYQTIFTHWQFGKADNYSHFRKIFNMQKIRFYLPWCSQRLGWIRRGAFGQVQYR